ncbi:cyanophycin synthase [alpha proteobacterium U9-1i]|nr:cyanophycin synthase [alpha proteobacterium U9-1i]
MAFTKACQADALLSTHARYASRTAAACGYGFRSLDGADGYLFEVADGARRALFACGAGSPYALNDARAASLARDKAFAAEALRANGLPVLPGRVFFITKQWAEMRGPGREPEDARTYAANARYPIFCKPISASNGLYAEIVEDVAGFEDYLTRVAREHFAILVQPYVRGPEYRVFVLHGRPLFSYRKQLPVLVGDGRTTLGALIEATPRDHGGPAVRWRVSDEAGAPMALETVLAEGESVTLEGPANRAAGGGATDVREGAAPELAALACAASKLIGLGLAGVDIFDVSPARDLSALQIIEVNSNPMIKTLEDHGRWDLIEAVWRANFEAAWR